jgi:sec-independent protein translocase protein TatA
MGYGRPVGFFVTPWHILLLILIALLLFGGKRLPRLGRSLGVRLRDAKDGITGGTQEFKDGISGQSRKAADRQPALPPGEPAVSQRAAETERKNA